ncbi:H-type small acid-soluble spore protein [Brevibacillus sp. SYSU BS000544]|uniref:H-type small acid-soluble spore protein n=1 Tax=Brevibacillus sp. SYSU BS000544 TaxID=3416443 RepID=UPI003CE46686
MDVNRALQIVQSEEKIQVMYQGVPVWIDGVEEATNTVRIHPESDPKDTKRVSVKLLDEK